MSHVKHIGKLVLRASDVIEHHNFEALADIFNECHADLKALTVHVTCTEGPHKVYEHLLLLVLLNLSHQYL
jgi:hypothetical protein